MALIPVIAKQACYTADNRYHEEGERFVWTGDPEQLPPYLEKAGKAEEVELPPRQREFAGAEERSAAIFAALKQLDPNDDDQWTADGQPRMEVVQDLVGDDTITRAELRAIAPEVVRPV